MINWTTMTIDLQDIMNYNCENDILYLKIKGHKVDHTVCIQNILFDVGNSRVVGVKFSKASDFLGVDKDFLNSLKYFEIYLDIKWKEILMIIMLWNAEEETRKIEKRIKVDSSEREGLPSGHFKFGNFRGLQREKISQF